MVISIMEIQGEPYTSDLNYTSQKADSLFITNRSMEKPVPDTDVLQESLYVRILYKITKPEAETTSLLPKNNLQLLQINKEYYSTAYLQGDTLVIPYPQQKVKELKEIRYLIPDKFFKYDTNSSSLQPVIVLTYNPSKSTVAINQSYPITFYRFPEIDFNSSEKTVHALCYLYNLLLPYSGTDLTHITREIKAIIYYKSYTPHEINIKSSAQLMAFIDCLRKEGSLYFYPYKIDDLEESLNINGLLYVMHDENLNVYHFGELNVIFLKNNQYCPPEFKLIFYPFIKNNDVSNSE